MKADVRVENMLSVVSVEVKIKGVVIVLVE